MYRLDVEEEPVKVERCVIAKRQGGSITINPAKCVYLLLPAELARQLQNDFGFDIRKDKRIEKYCSLVLENSEGEQTVKVMYEFRKAPRVTKLMEVETEK